MVTGSMKRKLLLSFSFLIAASILTSYFPNPLSIALAKKPTGSKSKPVSTPVAPSALSSEPAPKDNSPPVVASFEQRLFFKTYPDDELTLRLSRIEKQVFGQPIAESIDSRLGRLEEILRSKLEEERKAKEGQTYRNGQAASSTGSGGKGTNPGAQGANQDEDDIERARLSIQAAREEEISVLLAEGVELYRHKRGMQAQEKFEQVLRLDSQNAQAHFNLGIIEETMGNFVEALSSYKQAAQKEPDNKEYLDAVAATEKKASTQARLVGKRADLRVLAESANAAWKRGEYISALDLYQQLDAKEPNRALIKYNIGSIYLMLKDQHSALDFYKLATKLEPNEQKYAKAYQGLASELKKASIEQSQVEKEATADWQAARAPNDSASSKQKVKASKKGNSNKSAKNAPQYSGSPFAPYAVMGGNQGQPVQQQQFRQQPQQQQSQQQFRQQPQQQQVQQQSPQQQPQSANVLAQWGLMGRSNGDGVTIVNVGAASRAATAGVVPGDDIKAIDGVQVTSTGEMADVLSRRNPGNRIPILIMRNGNLAVINL